MDLTAGGRTRGQDAPQIGHHADDLREHASIEDNPIARHAISKV
jgi:hypothetical protein